MLELSSLPEELSSLSVDPSELELSSDVSESLEVEETSLLSSLLLLSDSVSSLVLVCLLLCTHRERVVVKGEILITRGTAVTVQEGHLLAISG